MNKKLFLIPLAAAMMSSCANQDFDGDNNYTTGETETRYLAVNIVDNSDATRADYDTDYENGSAAENEVKNIRFYLFDGNGDSYSGTKVVNTTAEDDGKDLPNVEKKLQAVIVFETPKAATGTTSTPLQIVAVVNPPERLPDAPANVEALQKYIENANISSTTAGTFVMTNAVYAENESGSAKEHVAYTIGSSNICESKAAALANPVTIYVERVMAKAKVSLAQDLLNKKVSGLMVNGSELDNVYRLDLEEGENTIYTSSGSSSEKTIYLQLLGWNLTGTATKSRLVKKVNPAWGGTDWNTGKFAWGLNNAWNYPTFKRSFWAINPDNFEKTDLQFGDFNTTNAANAITDFTGNTPVYMQENASWDWENKTGENPDYATKLIVAGRLIDERGDAVQLGWYAGAYYLQEDLKQVILNSANIFVKTTEAGNVVKYKPADTEDIIVTFKTATEAGKYVEGNTNVNRYNSYATTNTAVEADKFYTKDADGYKAIADLEALQALLLNVGPVKVWTSGYTYYWVDIKHLAPEGTEESPIYGSVGVVRNHVYSYTLSNFKGFGIPVEKPGETIYPEVPNDPKMMYIAAQINILSWRLVNHSNTELGW